MRTIWLSGITCLLVFLPFSRVMAADDLSINNLVSESSVTLTSSHINAGMASSGNIDFCVVSKKTDTTRDKFSFTVEQATGSNNQFKLYNGSHEMPFTMKIGSYYNKDNQVIGLDNLEDISPNETTQNHYQGGLSCADGNYGKSRITFNLSIQPYGLTSGTYTASVIIKAKSNGSVVSQPLTIRVTVPSMVNISRLNDVTLTRHGSLGYYGGSDDFCVYSTTGSFLISAEGMPSDNNNFLMHKGSATLSYNVILGRNDHLGGTFTVTPGQKVDILATPVDCQMADNSQVSIAVVESIANAAESGTYTGTVYLRVEPI